jgi:hypothetical protein
VAGPGHLRSLSLRTLRSLSQVSSRGKSRRRGSTGRGSTGRGERSVALVPLAGGGLELGELSAPQGRCRTVALE